MSKIIISEFMDQDAVEWLQGLHQVHYEPDLYSQREKLSHLLRTAEALIVRNRTHVDTELLGAAPQLSVVGRLGVGLDNIDSQACKNRGVQVIPATGANAAAVAEYVICCAMMLLRGAYGVSRATADGQWPRDTLINGQEIAGKTLGIIGFGSVGRRTAELALAVGMQVIAYDPSLNEAALPQHLRIRPRPDVDTVLHEADVVSLHVPLVPATRNLIDAQRISSMKRGAILINVARGGVLDEAALAQSLADGHLGGAALDVYATEPLPGGTVLANAPNLILTPHIAGVTKQSNIRVSTMIAEHVHHALHHKSRRQQ